MKYIFRLSVFLLYFSLQSVYSQTEKDNYLYIERPPIETPVWSDNDEEWTWDWEKLDSLIVRDTITDTLYVSRLEDVTRHFGISFDEYVRRFMMFKDEQDSARVISSERVYLNYFLPMLASSSDFANKRLVSREYALSHDSLYTKLTLKEYPLKYYYSLDGLALDIMVNCYGGRNTDIFLQSSYARQTTIEQLFSAIHFTRNRTIQGINFYFPDYSFRYKRDMAQFVKSLSLVTDSSRIEGIRGLKLYLTFDLKEGEAHEDFLCCLTQMADSVFLIDQQPELNVVPVMKVIDRNVAEELSVFSKMRNQLFLARYAPGDFPETDREQFNLSDIRAVMYSDYDDNTWETYMWILVGILIVICVLIVVYYLSSSFSRYVNKNLDYIYALLILLALEIYLLVFMMIENMSKDNIFTFGGENQMAILFMPLLFIFIIPIMKSLRNRKYLP